MNVYPVVVCVLSQNCFGQVITCKQGFGYVAHFSLNIKFSHAVRLVNFMLLFHITLTSQPHDTLS